MPPRSLATGADDDAESAAHPVVAEARHGLDVVVEKDESQKPGGASCTAPPSSSWSASDG